VINKTDYIYKIFEKQQITNMHVIINRTHYLFTFTQVLFFKVFGIFVKPVIKLLNNGKVWEC